MKDVTSDALFKKCEEITNTLDLLIRTCFNRSLTADFLLSNQFMNITSANCIIGMDTVIRGTITYDAIYGTITYK